MFQECVNNDSCPTVILKRTDNSENIFNEFFGSKKPSLYKLCDGESKFLF